MAEIQLQGMDELLKRLEEMATKTANAITKKALEESAKVVLADAQNTSVFADKTGRLREGLKIGKVKTKNGVKYIEIGIDKGDISTIFYGKFIEWGTSNQASRPFLQPALERNKRKIKEILIEELRKGLGL
jgi:HK97 gp10 family phage protein